ncbi:MAG: hypothetical protein WCX65_18580 [bacterium]
MKKFFCLIFITAALLTGCFAASGARADGGPNKYEGAYMIPGPGEKGYDEQLALKARRFDRRFHAFNAFPMGIGPDVSVPLENEEQRRLIERFVLEDDGWDFEKFSGGKTAYDVIAGWDKTAGLYAGVAVAADAFRYAVLRDQNADPAEVAIALKQLIAALDAMHIAFTIGGKPGVVARGLLKKGLPGPGLTTKTTPQFDAAGNPLPAVKNNGTWREDNSGQYPGYIWEDSISRDQMLGWAMASAAASEIMRGDPAFPEELKSRLRADSDSVCRAMRVVHKNGYDLEFPDADGRTTFFGHLNENNLDGQYIPGLKNGFYAMMSLGIYAAFSYAAENPESEKYLYNTLIKKRKLPNMALQHMKFVDMGAGSNFSNYNMAFTAGWLAVRYINDAAAREKLVAAIETKMYATPGATRQPVEMKQSLFDLIYAGAKTGGTAFTPPAQPSDAAAVGRAIETLIDYPQPPFFEFHVENCGKADIEALRCRLPDGTEIKLLGAVGWGDQYVADRPIPMKYRPASNYYWRSNPYEPNGGGNGGRMPSAADFRVAYWLGRWTRVVQEK